MIIVKVATVKFCCFADKVCFSDYLVPSQMSLSDM